MVLIRYPRWYTQPESVLFAGDLLGAMLLGMDRSREGNYIDKMMAVCVDQWSSQEIAAMMQRLDNRINEPFFFSYFFKKLARKLQGKSYPKKLY